MKILLSMLALILCAVTAAPVSARPVSGPATWIGIGTQIQRGVAPSRWRIRLAFDKNGNAHIDYPTLHCGGALIRTGHAGNVVKFREHLRYGRKICIDNGTVTAWRRGNRLFWRWSGVGTTHPAIRARATLVLSRHRGR
ncbi:hypothetical protein LMIY3S_05369 [Labrys miyagiensis]